MTAAHASPALRQREVALVVGSPRSGTTWVQRLLAAHPRVRTGQESNLFEHYVGPALRHWRLGLDPRNRGGVGMACYLTEEEFRRVFDPYFDALLAALLAGTPEDCVFVEKTPTHAQYVPEIHALLPRARFVHVVRDARDTVASLLAAHRGWGANWAPGNSVRAAMAWLRNVEAVRDARAQLPDLQLLEVRYEDLQARPAEGLRRLADFLGLAWSDDEIQRAVRDNAAGRPGTPIPVRGEVALRSDGVVAEPEGFVRKARVGSWRADLGLRDRLVVWLLARRTMAEHGYRWRLPL